MENKKPTIAELEAMLDEPNKKITILPDGSICVKGADEIIALQSELEKVKKENGELEKELIDRDKTIKAIAPFIDYVGEQSEIIRNLQSKLSEAKLDIVRNQNIILEMEQEAKEAKEKLGRVTVDNLEKVLKENKACEHRDDYGCRPCYYEMATALVTAINGKE